MDVARPPSRGACSRTTTLSPASASRTAALRPANPAPMTTTSAEVRPQVAPYLNCHQVRAAMRACAGLGTRTSCETRRSRRFDATQQLEIHPVHDLGRNKPATHPASAAPRSPFRRTRARARHDATQRGLHLLTTARRRPIAPPRGGCPPRNTQPCEIVKRQIHLRPRR
jgi:hypothetical protein